MSKTEFISYSRIFLGGTLYIKLIYCVYHYQYSVPLPNYKLIYFFVIQVRKLRYFLSVDLNYKYYLAISFNKNINTLNST